MLLKDIVKLDTQGKFISAVQLSDYDKPEDNLSLVKSYIFAESAPNSSGGQARVVGSIDLLKDLRLAFNNNSSNCFVVIANYGHGKSHLGLVLANYFARSFRSQEVTAILKRIDQSLNNPAKAEDYHEFKRQNDRFLVLRLSGDTHKTLREQFFPALKKALREHKEIQSVELPFWNQQAKLWLESKADDKETKKFLKDNFRTDIPSLIQEVEETTHEAYEQYVALFKHLNSNVAPNPEGDYDLKEAINWAVDICNKSKVLKGVLILFDEFSQFVQRYSEDKTIGDLQNLLLGIQDHRGKALFLAFAQHDPESIADQYSSGERLQSLQRELTRIERKYALYSLMESVLDSYLAQSDANWEKLLASQPRVRGSIFRPTELVWELYSTRYNRELRWTNDKFRDVVTKGCFPLHPLTTALLCHLKMQQRIDDDPRTILRFVTDRFEHKCQEELARPDGTINRIYPIELVDYFENRIGSVQLYSAYETASKNIEQAFDGQSTAIHHSVLKALFLHEADNLHTTGDQQIEVLSEMAGLDTRTTLRILKELGDKSITKYDKDLRANSLWLVAIDPKALEDRIKDEISNRKFNEELVYSLNSDLPELLPGSSSIPVPVEWGNSDDWASKSVVVTRETLTPDGLQKHLQLHSLSFQGLKEGNRGLVCWLLALDDSDLKFFSENAGRVLQEAFPNEIPAPVLLVLPKSANPTLANFYLRYKALDEIGRDPDVIKKIGQSGYDLEVERIEGNLVKALGNLLGDGSLYRSIPRRATEVVVHRQYKANLASIAILNIDSILRKLYELAYPYRPPEFFTELPANPKRGARTVGDGVKIVARNLIYNRINSTIAGMAKFAQDRICKQQLMSKWHILSTRYFIAEPDIKSLKSAWDYLDNSVRADEKDFFVKEFIPSLLVPPYGFDYNTATLLLCAWIGKNHTKLTFSARSSMTGSKLVGLDYLESLLDKETPQEFLSKLCTQDFAIARRDVDKALNAFRDIVADIEKRTPRGQADTEQQIGMLEDILRQDVLPEDEKEAIVQTLKELQDNLEIARKYDKEIKTQLPAISRENNLRKLLGLEGELKEVESPGLVLPTQPKLSEVQKQLKEKIERSAKETCQEITNLKNIEGADAARTNLRDYRDTLTRRGYTRLASLFDEAENTLDQRIEQFKSIAAEAAAIEQLNAMTSKADLVTLYQYQEKLKQIEKTSEHFARLHTKKLDEVKGAIGELEVFAENIEKSVKEIKPEQLGAFYDAIVSREGKYIGSEYEDAMAGARKYTTLLRSYFDELKALRMLVVRVPEDAREMEARTEKISKAYASKLYPGHKAYLQGAKDMLAEKLQCEYEKSERIIKEVERQVKTAAPIELRKRIDSLAFIDRGMNTRIKAVLTKLEEREAQDVIGQIEYLFTSIRDPKKRAECLKRLQSIK